VTLPNSKG